jgi:hypothetical protein
VGLLPWVSGLCVPRETEREREREAFGINHCVGLPELRRLGTVLWLWLDVSEYLSLFPSVNSRHLFFFSFLFSKIFKHAFLRHGSVQLLHHLKGGKCGHSWSAISRIPVLTTPSPPLQTLTSCRTLHTSQPVDRFRS